MFENIQNKYIIALIDPEYYYSQINSFSEDAHPRSRLTNKLYKREKDRELRKIEDPNITPKKLDEKLKEIGNSNQYRKYIRGKSKEERNNLEYYRKNRDKFIEINKGKADPSRLYAYKDAKRQLENEIIKNTPLKDQGSSASYIQPLRVLVKTNDNPRAEEHEKRHYRDDMYVRSQYGRSASDKLYHKQTRANNMANIDKRKSYKADPMEYNALKVGSSMRSKTDPVNYRLEKESRRIMDRAVRGKSTPKATDVMINKNNDPNF